MKYLLVIFTIISINVQSQDWSFVEDLAPIESAESDFGINMVFADDKLVVSWPRIFTRGNDADNCGEVITYTKDSDGKYQELARLTAEDLTGSCTNGDGFGFGLSYNDGRLVIGMPAGVRGSLGQSGGMTDADSRVFITTFENGNWSLQQELTANDLSNGVGMGFHVVMDGDVLLVFGHEYDTIFGFTFPVATAVYVFENNGTEFQQTQKLEEDFHLFGQDFDYENGQIIVGAWGEQAVTQPGRIYVYEKNGSSWEVVQTINDTRNSNLGNQIEILGDTMIAGSVQAGGVGGVTVFNNTNGQWTETQYIQASDSQFNDQFGIMLQIDEDELFVGAGAGEDASLTLGAVYTFKKGSDGQYVEQQKLIAQNPTNLYDRFAGNLIFNDTDLLVSSTSGGFDNADVTSYHHFSRDGVTTPAKYSVNAKNSGSWVVEGADNQNINIEILNDGRAVIFASLNHNSDNLWLFGVGEINNHIIDFTHVYSTNGAQFGSVFASADVNIVDEGEAQLVFNLCNQATFSYSLAAIESNEIEISKALEIPGNECATTNKSLQIGMSGAWFDPSRSGEGFTVYISEQNGTQKADITWYTYDNNGNQLWLSGQGSVSDQSVTITEMKQFTGAHLFSGTTQSTLYGSLSMSWNDCNQAVIDYDFTVNNLGTGQFNVNQLTNLDNTQCNLAKKSLNN